MISVAMCTYNGADHIREQLHSIAAQTVQPDEIVICDDGSTDETIAIIKETLANWPGEVRVIENETNLGFSRNFQKAISLCKGEIIFLCDQDDVWHREKIAIMKDVLDKHPEALLAVHDSVLVDEQRQVLEESFWDYFSPKFNPAEFEAHNYGRLFMGNVVQGCACALRRELFQQAQPFPAAACHDEWLTLVAAAQERLLLVREGLLEYRQWNNQIGALRPSVWQRVKKWAGNFAAAKDKQMAERQRRNDVLSAFSERYGKRLSVPNQKILAATLKLGQLRVSKIQGKKCSLLFDICSYMRIYPGREAVKLWCKDLLIVAYKILE